MERLAKAILNFLMYIWNKLEAACDETYKKLIPKTLKMAFAVALATIIVGAVMYYLEPKKMTKFYREKQNEVPQSIEQNIRESNIMERFFKYSEICGKYVYVMYIRVETTAVGGMTLQCKHFVNNQVDLLAAGSKYQYKPKIAKKEKINTHFKQYLLNHTEGEIYELGWNTVMNPRSPLEPLQMLFHHINFDYIRYTPIYDEQLDLILLIGFIVENKELLKCDTYNLDAYLEKIYQDVKG